MFWTWFGRFLNAEDDGTPVGINITVGAVAMVVSAFIAARIPTADPQLRCAVVALAIGGFAAFTVDRRALVAVILPAWLIMNGFLVNRLGDLSWHGTADVDRFLVLVVAGAAGLVAGATGRRLHGVRDRWQMGALVEQMQVHEMNAEINEETKRRA